LPRLQAKTDGLDVRALAHCADAVRPAPRPLPDAHTEELRALLARRRQLIAMRTAEQNRLDGVSPRLWADILRAGQDETFENLW